MYKAPTDPRYPAHRYSPDGRDATVCNPEQDEKLLAAGWAEKPFPPPPDPEHPIDCANCKALSERLSETREELTRKEKAFDGSWAQKVGECATLQAQVEANTAQIADLNQQIQTLTGERNGFKAQADSLVAKEKARLAALAPKKPKG